MANEPTMPTTVLHVSDLHFGKPAVLEQIDAIERAVQARHFDVIAVSGDFSQRARAGEFQRAAVFLREAEKHGKTICVPGNHDVAWWYAPLGLGNRDRVYENYRQYISPDLEPTLQVPGAIFAGVNTSHGVTSRTLTWNVRDISIIGDLTPSQIQRLQSRLETAEPDAAKIVVMHHNPVAGELSQRHGLKHTKRILDEFAGMGVNLVLCGHDHQESVRYIGHTRKGVIVSTAGTVSNRSRGGRPSSYNVITITPTTIEVVTRVWTNDAQDFVPGPHQCFDR
jgi:3',5'-cyclic AMP phosphodiesterase CpdA